MTTTATKTNREVFIEESSKLIVDAKSRGKNLSRIKALRGYMQEVLTGVPAVETEAAKARILGEMYATDEQCANALLAFARERAKYTGDSVPDAMVAIVNAGIGLYSQSSPLWKNMATICLMDKKTSKDFLYLLANLSSELRYVADKANNLMNEVLVSLGTKESKKGGFKKGAKSTKDEALTAEGTPEAQAVSNETTVGIDSIIKALQSGGLEAAEIAMVLCQFMVVKNDPMVSEIFSESAIAGAMADQEKAEKRAAEKQAAAKELLLVGAA